MQKNSLVPALRFEGFTDGWKQGKLGDMLETRRGLTYKPSDICDMGIRVLRSSNIDEDNFVLRNDDVFVKKQAVSIDCVKENDILITAANGSSRLVGKHAIISKIQNGVAVHGGFMLLGTTDEPYFVNASMSSSWYKHFIALFVAGGNGAIGNLNKNDLDNQDILTPSKKEQQQIGVFFRSIDNLIILHQRKYDQLCNFKKAMLEKMFPRENATVPMLRFVGFTDDWKLCKFSSLVTPYADPVPTPTDGYYRLGIRSHAKGTFHNYVHPGMELETAQMHRVAPNNFIVNITFAWEHAVAITNENDAGKLVSHRFPQFSFNNGMISDFFKFEIVDENFRHHLWLASPGGAGRNRVLKIDEMLEYKFWVPSASEQRKIAAFLGKLDDLITLQLSKIERLRNLKKALLDKMFV